ncbi:site-specific integrase [Dyella japonica]|uniref:Integrase n=1 Tax=Dyella japonica TaxID=231455 RepID=A0ABV2JUJ0_9GAMM
MGRKRTANKHLPRRMQLKHGAYYYVSRKDGKPHWLRLGDDYAIALQEWAKLEGAARPDKMTVGGAIAHYLQVAGKRLSPRTVDNYGWSAKALLPVFGEMLLEEVERSHVYTYLVQKGNVAANRDRALLSAAYNHMMNAGLYKGENPAAGMRFRNKETARDRYVTDAELDALVAQASTRFGDLLQFAYITGMRQLDLVSLNLTAATDDGIAYIDSKTKKRHVIGWTDELTTLWKRIAGLRIGSQPAFLTRDGTRYTTTGLKASWRHVKLRAKLGDLTFHDIRRKSGSDADDEAHAQQLLGHADPKVTRKHYRAKPTTVSPITPNNRQKRE